jgi:hypothetical protein
VSIKRELALQEFQVSGSKFQVENSLASSVQGLESETEECFLKKETQAEMWSEDPAVALAIRMAS